ncbi:hypothetical protein BVRB_8g186690 [Beta vulgaris subsp. vulgaris]|nr:hypothetical protein BVRB_8g186690 [Beta vulgaris subsp. vulgaris]
MELVPWRRVGTGGSRRENGAASGCSERRRGVREGGSVVVGGIVRWLGG